MSNSCKSCPSASTSGGCSSGHDPKSCGEKPANNPDAEKIAKTLGRIKHKIVVLSGKGGVG
ncbi:MAG: ATP-binding protein, partial [Humidesulfovibrio sp.]|nr:ATP-binding protein [Humidesulfovibrio sp.]